MNDLRWVSVCDDGLCGKCKSCRIAELEALVDAEMESNHRLAARELELEAKVERLRAVYEAAKEIVDGPHKNWPKLRDAIAAAQETECSHEWGVRQGGFLEHCRKCGAIADVKENSDV